VVSWDRVFCPKKIGGFGLHKIEAINKAFLCKLSRKHLTDLDNFWVKVMRTKYPTALDLFTCTYKSNDSWA